MPSFSKLKIMVNILRLTLVAAIVVSIFYDSLSNALISSFTLILTFLPAWFEKKYKIIIPLDFEFAIIFFVYASIFLGEVGNFYERFWWWDILLHGGSAVAFGCIGFIVLFILFKANKIKSSPVWLALFSFCFAVSIGVVWEIFEFAMDQIFGLNMQKSGLIDTMWDLIVDCSGAILASFAGYGYIKGNERSYLAYISGLIGSFIKSNPGLKWKIF